MQPHRIHKLPTPDTGATLPERAEQRRSTTAQRQRARKVVQVVRHTDTHNTKNVTTTRTVAHWAGHPVVQHLQKLLHAFG